jgi:hypothetical protein
MKTLVILLSGAMGLAMNAAIAGNAPAGNLLEVHSCEVFAGGCVVSSEAQQGGRYMLRVWEFNGGGLDGRSVSGQCVAVLQLSPDNLAATDSRSGEAVVYLPKSATESQRESLLAWVRQPDFRPSRLSTRIAPIAMVKSAQGYAFKAGDFISVETKPVARCESNACGEMLWYEPRSATSLFTVAVSRALRVDEPLLKLKWNDDGKRNAFLGRFGAPDSARNVQVTMSELCGGSQLF